MAALTSGSWTITYKTGDRRSSTGLTDNLKYVNIKLALVSGEPPATLTLPGYQSVGLVARLDKYIIDNPVYVASGNSGSAVSGPMIVKYNSVTGNTIKFFKVLSFASKTGGVIVPLVTTATIKAQNLYVTAVGW